MTNEDDNDLKYFNQLLIEKYEEDILVNGKKVILKIDFLPHTNFYITVDLMVKELIRIFETDFDKIKSELVNTVESYYLEEFNVIVNKFIVFGNKLFVELPRSDFIWASEYDSLPSGTENYIIQ